MLRAAIAKGGVDVVALNDPFLDVNYMVRGTFSSEVLTATGKIYENTPHC